MPKYRPETARRKARKLVKACLDADLNESEVARREGVSQQAINQRIQKNSQVKKTFTELMDKEGLSDKYLRKKIKEGLDASKVVGYLNNKVEGTQKISDEFVEVPDMHCRHKYLVTALEVKKIIKVNGNEKGVNVSTIIFNIRDKSGLFTRTEAEVLSHKRS